MVKLSRLNDSFVLISYAYKKKKCMLLLYLIVIALIYENDNVEPAMLRLQSLVKTVAFYREGIYCYYRTILR